MGPFGRALAGSFAGRVLGAIFIAACTILGFGPERWVEFMISGLPAWWTPAIARAAFIALAVLTMLILWRPSFNRRNRPQTASVATKAPPPSEQTPSSSSNERIFVSASVTPAYLIGLFKEHTGIQAKRLIEQYIGTWMPITGTVHDTHQRSKFNFSKPEEKVAQLFIFNDGNLLIARFNEPWVERIAILRRGDKVRFIGKIADVSALNLELDDCEVVAGN